MISMRRIAVSLTTVIALSAPALAADAPHAAAPAAAAPVGTAPAGTAPATGEQLAQPGSPVFGDVGKVIDPATIPALQNIIVAGTQIRYLGDEYGLKAYFVTNAGQGQVVYTTPNSQAMIIGGMFAGDGTPVSVMQLARLRQAGFDPVPYLSSNSNPAPGAATATAAPATAATSAPAQLSPGEQLLNEVNRASWIAFGNSLGRPLTVFMDPNCDHCHLFFKQIKSYVDANKIYLRVVPVSVITEQSRGDMINILSGSDPAASWTAKINGQPVPPPTQVNPQAESSLAGNNAIFNRWQLGVTPYSIYRTNAGEIKVMAGEPTDLNAFLAELGVTP